MKGTPNQVTETADRAKGADCPLGKTAAFLAAWLKCVFLPCHQRPPISGSSARERRVIAFLDLPG